MGTVHSLKKRKVKYIEKLRKDMVAVGWDANVRDILLHKHHLFLYDPRKPFLWTATVPAALVDRYCQEEREFALKYRNEIVSQVGELVTQRQGFVRANNGKQEEIENNLALTLALYAQATNSFADAMCMSGSSEHFAFLVILYHNTDKNRLLRPFCLEPSLVQTPKETLRWYKKVIEMDRERTRTGWEDSRLFVLRASSFSRTAP